MDCSKEDNSSSFVNLSILLQPNLQYPRIYEEVYKICEINDVRPLSSPPLILEVGVDLIEGNIEFWNHFRQPNLEDRFYYTS